MKYAVFSFIITLGIFLLSSFSQDPKLKESIERGKEVYTLNCQNCHMEDGKGVQDVNPPLAGSDYLKKTTKTLIDIVLRGQSGEIIVNGIKYNSMMPAQDYLTDEQIADAYNYVRNSWGNKIPGAITPAMVVESRK